MSRWIGLARCPQVELFGSHGMQMPIDTACNQAGMESKLFTLGTEIEDASFLDEAGLFSRSRDNSLAVNIKINVASFL